jgi:glucose/arabinose dehydrogenase
MGDNFPPDELNFAEKPGLHFGFPFYNGKVLDKDFGHLKNNAVNYRFPALELPAHVAPLGLTFYTGKMFPNAYQHQLFIAEHVSYARWSAINLR